MTETTTHEAERDAEVLKGVLADPKPADKATPAPPRRGRRAAAAPATGTTKAPAKGKAPAKAAAAKPATRRGATAPAKAPAKSKPAPAKAESNGSAPSARETNQTLAVELIELVAGHFKGRSKADQEKLANWLKVLPTGGRGHERYWPKGFARPTTSDWRAPEA
jgi:hypothetical protein